MGEVLEHPSLRVSRKFDEALTRACNTPITSELYLGAVAAILVIAEKSGLAADPRCKTLRAHLDAALPSRATP